MTEGGAEPDACPFCLQPLNQNSLALPCGHTFHSACAVQFLLRKKQCPCCRAPVDETRVVDVSEVPGASGRQFLHVAPPAQQARPGTVTGAKRPSGSAGQVELLAFAGPTAEAAAARSRSQSWSLPPATPPWGTPPTSPPEGTGSATPTAGLQWLPDIFPVPSRSPDPVMSIVVEGQPAPAGSGAAAVEPSTSGTIATVEHQSPLRTITVVRRRPWLRRLLVWLLLALLVGIIVATPLIISNEDGSPAGRNGFSRTKTPDDCWLCYLDGRDCPGCPTFYTFPNP